MSLERKIPATPTVQDHLSLSILTGWQWRSQNQEHEPATAAHVSLSGRHLVPVQRAKPVAGVFVRKFSSTLPPPLRTSTEHPSFPSWSKKDKVSWPRVPSLSYRNILRVTSMEDVNETDSYVHDLISQSTGHSFQEEMFWCWEYKSRCVFHLPQP